MSTGRSPERGPWILGHRGAPRDAPENTLAALELALAIGLDGVEYDVRACGSDELCLLHDRTLDRTTDATGNLAARTLPELDRIDAGGWFGGEFADERIPLIGEALALRSPVARDLPFHMIELKEDGLVARLARELASVDEPPPVRVASFLRRAVCDARDHGLPAMLLVAAATPDVRAYVRDERLPALGLPPGGWRGVDEDWPCERWEWSVDEPDDLLAACARPLFGFNTNEPRRALAVRELVGTIDRPLDAYPVRVGALVVEPGGGLGASEGEWCGAWTVDATVDNPFDEAVTVRLDLLVQGGAFEVRDLPVTWRLLPRESRAHRFGLTGGSWSPGRDPRLAVTFERGAARGARPLVLDATMTRVREVEVGSTPRRLTLLREARGAPPASMTLVRQGRVLTCAIEHPGDVEEASTVVHLEGEVHSGGRSVRLRLPEPLGGLDRPLRFSCGLRGRVRGRRVLRRWAGGLGDGPLAGAPGRLWLRSSS